MGQRYCYSRGLKDRAKPGLGNDLQDLSRPEMHVIAVQHSAQQFRFFFRRSGVPDISESLEVSDGELVDGHPAERIMMGIGQQLNDAWRPAPQPMGISAECLA